MFDFSYQSIVKRYELDHLLLMNHQIHLDFCSYGHHLCLLRNGSLTLVKIYDLILIKNLVLKGLLEVVHFVLLIFSRMIC